MSTPLAFHGRPIIVGAGVAGLMTALELAPRPVVVYPEPMAYAPVYPAYAPPPGLNLNINVPLR